MLRFVRKQHSSLDNRKEMIKVKDIGRFRRLRLKFYKAASKQNWDICREVLGEITRLKLNKHEKVSESAFNQVFKDNKSKPLFLAAEHGSSVPLDIVERLLKLNPNAAMCKEPITSRYPLHVFVLNGAKLEVTKAVADAHTSALSALDQVMNRTPLHIACASPLTMPSVVDFLCNAGLFAVGIEDLEGNLPMEVLIKYGDTSDIYSYNIMMEILHKYGAQYWSRKRQSQELFRITRPDIF